MSHDLLPGRAFGATVAAATHPGQRRTENQDHYLVADLSDRDPDGALAEGGEGANGVTGPSRVEVGPRGLLLMVADGMGGAAGGATASAMACRAIRGLLATGWSELRSGTLHQLARHLSTAVEEANRLIHARSEAEAGLRGMGTTATVAGALDGHLVVAQIGDSRGYLVRDGTATQITRDQSVVQLLQEAGELDAAQARNDHRANLILQALGTLPEVTVDLTHHPLRQGDVLVLCSDGLSGVVEADEMAAAIADRSLADSAERLVALANERGAPDNVTVVVARFGGDALLPPLPDDPVGRMPLALEDG